MPALAVFWNGLPKWMRDALIVAGVILLGILAGKSYLAVRDEGVKKRTREKDTAKTIEVVNKIEHESSTDADQAAAARDAAPRYPDPGLVPEPVSDRIFRD